MGRIKGSKMTEAAKVAMRARRLANKEGKANALSAVADNIRYLSYDETEVVADLINQHCLRIRDEEEKRLLKMREEIDERIKKLKE